MTDKELLEAAANAAGYNVEPHPNSRLFSDLVFTLGARNWNPLTDDGDALRLAVKLKCLRGFVYDDEVAWAASELGIFEPIIDGDPYAATRRAIVRAAAAMANDAL